MIEAGEHSRDATTNYEHEIEMSIQSYRGGRLVNEVPPSRPYSSRGHIGHGLKYVKMIGKP